MCCYRFFPGQQLSLSKRLESKTVMSKGYVKGGTPIGSDSLCRTCSNAQVMTGYRESEMVTMCDAVHPNIVVPFRIYDCNRYHDRNKPTWQQMQKLAIRVSADKPKPLGFKVGAGFGQTTVRVVADDDDCSEDDD
jgi:hypothetical protein